MNALSPAVAQDTDETATSVEQLAKTVGTATYSPDDNKLRLYPFARLDAKTYDRVKAAGFRWAPKQELFVAPSWSPGREDLLIALCGTVDDEDTSLVERAEERADRFEGYEDARARDAKAARDAVARIADGIPLGQPILVGHHSERRARKDAERITDGMRRAVKMWETSEYWQRRAAGALAHAKYKELPGVRHRRIKKLTSDLRKVQAERDHAEKRLAAWTKDGLTLDEARALANVGYTIVERTGTSYRSASDVLWQDPPAWTVAQVVEVLRAAYPRTIARADRWISHYEHRLTYERAMLAEQIGDKSADGTLAGRFDFEEGGRVLVGSDWLTILRINKAGGAINSLTTSAPSGVTWQNSWNYGVERVRDYEPPTKEETKRVKDALKLPPLCNYPGEGFKEMTKAEWAKQRKWSDFMYVATLAATDTAGRHRVRRAPIGMMKYQQVYITDQKRVDPPAPATSAPATVPASRRAAPSMATARAVPAQVNDADAADFDAMRKSLKAGVQTVAVPQLFPTPTHIAARMVELAEIEEGHTLLEPSAGLGALLDAVTVPTDATIVEINPALAARLRERHDVVLNTDFLECGPELGRFDRIVMNPPFANAADIRHIQHAAKMLEPGGRLVALCAAGPRQVEALKPMADHWEVLPPGSFAEQGTNVNVALLVIAAPR